MNDRFGVNSHLIQTESLRRLAGIGVRWHRIDVEWAHVERVQGTQDWSDVDRIVEQASWLDLRLLAILAYTPRWAGTGNVPRNPQQFIDFVRSAVLRYGSRFAAYSVWNEPNLSVFWDGPRSSFISRIFRPALLEIRAQLPSAVLVGPDLSSAKNNKVLTNGWMLECLEAGRDLLNVVSHHQYDGSDTVPGRVRELERLHFFLEAHGFGHLPLWVTETGYDHVSPERQADLLRDTYRAMQMRSWWHKTFWYDSHGRGWGLLEPDLTPNAGLPRAAFHMLAQLLAEDNPPQEGD